MIKQKTVYYCDKKDCTSHATNPVRFYQLTVAPIKATDTDDVNRSHVLELCEQHKDALLRYVNPNAKPRTAVSRQFSGEDVFEADQEGDEELLTEEAEHGQPGTLANDIAKGALGLPAAGLEDCRINLKFGPMNEGGPELEIDRLHLCGTVKDTSGTNELNPRFLTTYRVHVAGKSRRAFDELNRSGKISLYDGQEVNLNFNSDTAHKLESGRFKRINTDETVGDDLAFILETYQAQQAPVAEDEPTRFNVGFAPGRERHRYRVEVVGGIDRFGNDKDRPVLDTNNATLANNVVQSFLAAMKCTVRLYDGPVFYSFSSLNKGDHLPTQLRILNDPSNTPENKGPGVLDVDQNPAVGVLVIGEPDDACKLELKLQAIRRTSEPGRVPSRKIKLTTGSTTTLDTLFATAQWDKLKGQLAVLTYVEEPGVEPLQVIGKFDYEDLDVCEGTFELFLR